MPPTSSITEYLRASQTDPRTRRLGQAEHAGADQLCGDVASSRPTPTSTRSPSASKHHSTITPLCATSDWHARSKGCGHVVATFRNQASRKPRRLPSFGLVKRFWQSRRGDSNPGPHHYELFSSSPRRRMVEPNQLADAAPCATRVPIRAVPAPLGGARRRWEGCGEGTASITSLIPLDPRSGRSFPKRARVHGDRCGQRLSRSTVTG
jgi:hypothetical protein